MPVNKRPCIAPAGLRAVLLLLSTCSSIQPRKEKRSASRLTVWWPLVGCRQACAMVASGPPAPACSGPAEGSSGAACTGRPPPAPPQEGGPLVITVRCCACSRTKSGGLLSLGQLFTRCKYHSLVLHGEPCRCLLCGSGCSRYGGCRTADRGLPCPCHGGGIGVTSSRSQPDCHGRLICPGDHVA